MNKFVIVLLALSAMVLGSAGCGSVPFIAQSNPTATSTRTPRPTFTPRPARPTAAPTETEALEPTEEPTQEIPPTQEPTDEPPPPTARPTRRPATKAPPTQPPAPPKPAFSVKATDKYICSQDGIFEIAVSLKRGRDFVEGVWFAAFDAGGTLLQDGAGKPMKSATYPTSQSTGSNCRLSGSFDSPIIDNGKLDVGDAVRQGTNPVIVRFVKSENDMTPISENFQIDFGKGGRYWIYAQMQ